MVSDSVRDYSRSWEAAFLCGVPWLGFVLGNIGVSLLRDAGFVIFPWIIMIPVITYLIATTVVNRLKFQRLSGKLSPV
ncbi:hypothetical protein WKV53_01450 [Luteolibacter sp. Y139]|uniref:Uncharacterized protein n=2 Tax=Luteolibacter soli TaxID=3135280 RepID=A0ABU9AN59_9BACT